MVQKKSSYDLCFQSEFIEDLRYWIKNDRNTALKVMALIEEITRDPFKGKGKPEPLRFVLSGAWSRRITLEHRMVYRVSSSRIDFLQCRYHY